MKRAARFAGSWYPGEADALRAAIRAAEAPSGPAVRARALILPHAGFRYSLRIGAPAAAGCLVPERVVVLCPNHALATREVIFWPRGSFSTPLGEVAIDEALTLAIQKAVPWVSLDETTARAAHVAEHAIELVLPLLQVRQPKLRIAAAVVAERSYERLAQLGRGIAAATQGEDVLIVASTDLSHFHDAAEGARRDARALERLSAFDPAGLLERCEREAISMCGVRPVVAALEAARSKGAERVEVVARGHSGEVSGDDERVVGYASARVV